MTSPPVNPSRRSFLAKSAAVSLGFRAWASQAHASSELGAGLQPSLQTEAGFGPLVKDPKGRLDLPKGFKYTTFSGAGEVMDDGQFVPARHDGMHCFPGPQPDQVILVRNHENSRAPAAEDRSERFAAVLDKVNSLPSGTVYDAGYGASPSNRPCLGGTTTLLYDLKERKLKRQILSLIGTHRNCSGGPTPWGSWISCEESAQRAESGYEQDHGFNFEVPADPNLKAPVQPVPLKAMGRFYHEAIGVDPKTGIAYQTEDRPDGLFYRFLPTERGNFAKGGELQALSIAGAPSFDTRNWSPLTGLEVGQSVEVRWRGLKDVEASKDDLRQRGFLGGAARFARGEGLFVGQGEMYFCCTSGGRAQRGQIWRYTPSPIEGERRERKQASKLELFFESSDQSVLNMCDNITIAPWGDVLVCEDGPTYDRVHGITPQGEIYPIANNAGSKSEIAGATFSPDGSTLFFNLQEDGVTVAVTGPWRS